jgi:ribosomal protein S3AE
MRLRRYYDITKNQETLRSRKALRIQRKQNSDCNTGNYGVKMKMDNIREKGKRNK